MQSAVRSGLEACLTDAVSRASMQAEVREHSSVEGTYLTVTDAESQTPIAIATAVPPTHSPFDEIVRDRARSVAARLQAPWVLVTSFRTTVLYSVDRVTRRLPQEETIVCHAAGADVGNVDEIMISAHRVAETESIRTCLAAIGANAPAPGKAPFMVARLTALLEEMIACTNGQPPQITSVERLGTSIIGYALLTLRYPETLQAMQIPYGARSSELILDLIGAYLREANRAGHHLFPDSVSEFQVQPDREGVFTSALADLIRLVDDMRLDRFRSDEIHHVVDAMLLWCARVRKTPVPTVDGIDLAIMASHLSDLPHQAAPRILEIGSTIGMVGVRARLILPRAETSVFAATDLEERQLLLRASGQMDERRDARILRSLDDTDVPWDVLCISFTQEADPYQLQTLLSTVPLSSASSVILFVPLSVLRERSFTEFRQYLVEHLDLRWVFTADAEPLAEPDNGTCCLVLQPLVEGGFPAPSNFGFIRSAISSLIPPAASLRSFSLDRAERFRVFLRYLVSSERGKINQEVVVRRVARQSLLMRAWDADAGWDDFIVPPDVIASILRKLAGKLQRLTDLGDVYSGLRTGANEILAPDVGEIADSDLEDQYWQRTLDDGSVVDNTIVTAADEVVSIGGIPSADRRLLLLPENRSAMDGSQVLTHIERAERDGVHTRPSLRSREPWWHLDMPPTPHLIIPKQQRHRWLIATNAAHAFVTDSCIGVVLHTAEHAEAIALWMNSSLAMFMSELVQTSAHVADVTVRDAKEFPVPSNEILQRIDARKFKDLLYRPQTSLADEFGSDYSDVVRPHLVRRDRRRLDRVLMSDVFGMTDEEQRWVYRFALAWRGSSTNIRHLANALATQISMAERLQPMWQWYAPRMEQLPEGATRTVVVPESITGAEYAKSMFTHQVTLFKGTKREDVIDCSSAEEAELISILVNLGKRTIDVPTDEPLLNEALPLVRSFADRLEGAVNNALAVVPTDIRSAVRSQMYSVMVS